MSENIQPYDYQHPAQILYVYEMHQVMERRFDISLVVPGVLCVDPTTLDIMLDFYADWKNNRDINFNVLDYGMIGITKPVTVIGCATMTLAGTLSGIVTGALVTLVWKQSPLSPWLQQNIIKYELVPAFLLAALALVVVSLLTRPPDDVDSQFRAMKAD